MDAANNSPDSATYGIMDGSDLFQWMSDRSRKVLDQLEMWDNDQFPESASIDSTDFCVTPHEEFFSEKCTSPDGLGGTDCCAPYGEPKTCALGYKPKKLDDYCWYTCVSSSGMTVAQIVWLSIVVVIAVVIIGGIATFAIRGKKRKEMEQNN